jgi:hypothetical protein
LDEGQRRYAFDDSGLVKVDSIFDPIALSRNPLSKIHVEAALTHQPSLDLRSKGRGFAPILRPSFVETKRLHLAKTEILR